MKRWIVLLISIGAIVSLVAWRLASKSKDAQMAAQGRVAQAKAALPVTVAPIVARDIIQTFTGVGSVVAPFNVKIAPKVSGRLDYLQVREGARVQQGEVIARIDPSEILAQVNQQRAAVAEAQQRLAQAQFTQNPTNVNVATQIQTQVAAVASAQADANQTRENYASQVAAANAAVTDAQGRIDSAQAAITSANANIRSAQANLTNAQVRYNRTYDLYKQGYVAAQDVDDAKTTVSVQNEAVGVAQSALNAANAARSSAAAQKNAAQEQANIVAKKGKADIAAADARLAQAKSALKYARSNVAQTPAYAANLAALRASVSAAQAQLKNVEAQLDDTILRSPVSGFVNARFVDPGSIVSPSQPVIGVEFTRDVFVDTSIPEDIANHLRAGQPADVTFDSFPGRKFDSHITQITPAADPTSRQMPVRVTLNNPNNTIKPGMFARVAVITDRIAGALVAPREAVQTGRTGSFVILVDKANIAHRVPVELGAQDAAGFQIRSGVHAGDMVVTLVNGNIKDGAPVKSITLAARGAPRGRGAAPESAGRPTTVGGATSASAGR
ncbi:MAG TPA: efflux RND transporter periplasmic adaptor subunit [Chthonomonadaceae bacterium]|nr:efflux RND transporter periplasmic adaptor subunit [Chthonomonadaceae bacterium]